MVDDLTPADPDMQFEPADETDDKRSLWRLAAAVALAIVIIAVALFALRSCRAGGEGDSAGGRGGVITTAPTLDRREHAVSVWVKPGNKVKEILARNGYPAAATLNMGDGLYVVTIRDQDPRSAVERLKEDPGLYDAGFVYVERDKGK